MTSPRLGYPTLTPTRKAGVSLGLGTCLSLLAEVGEGRHQALAVFPEQESSAACPSFINIVSVSLTHSHS